MIFAYASEIPHPDVHDNGKHRDLTAVYVCVPIFSIFIILVAALLIMYYKR